MIRDKGQKLSNEAIYGIEDQQVYQNNDSECVILVILRDASIILIRPSLSSWEASPCMRATAGTLQELEFGAHSAPEILVFQKEETVTLHEDNIVSLFFFHFNQSLIRVIYGLIDL